MEEHDGCERRVTVRSRWSPKPEQIVILESIFNSGTVNPSKDETVRIRKLLEKFGAVADANVFYWFQNRRSRSRRRQRQLQQLAAEAIHHHVEGGGASASATHQSPPRHHHHDQSNNDYSVASDSSSVAMAAYVDGCSSSDLMAYHQQPLDYHHHALFFSVDHHHVGFPEIDHTCDINNFSAGSMMVFINGVATEVPRGPIDLKSLFGEDAMLAHSSGLPLPTNEFGFLMQGLQDGESYFLVSKAS